MKLSKSLEKQACLAEEAGFEPACRISPTIRFRIGAVMATSVPLRNGRR